MDGRLSHRLRDLRACQTADDVLRKALENHRFRQRMFPRPPPIRYVPPPKPEPKPVRKPIQHVTIEPRLVQIAIPATMREMRNAVADHLHIARMRIIKSDRYGVTVNTRHLLFLLIKVLLKKSSNEIGRCFRRDHTTVLHAFRRYPWTLRQLQQHTDHAWPFCDLVEHAQLLMRIEAELCGRKQPRFLNGR